ncbi:hypothetical protein BDZ91DRAFT_716104, partial [Kalaharituber pfeilii]
MFGPDSYQRSVVGTFTLGEGVYCGCTTPCLLRLFSMECSRSQTSTVVPRYMIPDL